MTLNDDIAQFQRNTAKSLETLEEVCSLANRLLDCSVDDFALYLSKLQDLCDQALTEVRYTAEGLVETNQKWGSTPLQHYLGKQMNTGDASITTVEVEHTISPSVTSSHLENDITSQEVADLLLYIEQAKEILDNAIDISGKCLNQVAKTGINLQAMLMIATSLTGVALAKTGNLFEDVVDGISSSVEINNRLIAQTGMPVSENSWFTIIKQISDRTEEYFGIDGELATAYEMQKDEEEKQKNRRLK
ncbi:hypothetical protein [Nostoc sp. 106C]|uniref:hypothetical protein n=1 Tax=Nostoc sp. 106C TaxID=1932667 RepID=UPI000A36B2C1|nr:hypothetical protein [Nostoc sp. 106C]OUL33962.1 hypothetical protein BV375_06170 [Nostoc sp. 106C]